MLRPETGCIPAGDEDACMRTDPGGVWRRLRANAHDPEVRRYVFLLMSGKAIGLGALVAAISWFLPAAASAQGAPAAPDATATINAINTAWTLVAAFLVFG